MTFENVEKVEDAVYVVVGGGGVGKAVWLASRALSEERPRLWLVVVDVEDLGEVVVDYRNQEIPSVLHDPFGVDVVNRPGIRGGAARRSRSEVRVALGDAALLQRSETWAVSRSRLSEPVREPICAPR